MKNTKIFLLLATALLSLGACAGNEGSATDSSDNTSSDVSTTESESTESTETETEESTGTVEPVITKSVYSITEKSSITKFKANSIDESFKLHDNAIQIGDDNAFDFKPVIKIKITQEGQRPETQIKDDWGVDVKIQRLVEGSFVDMDKTTQEVYVESLDDIKCKIDFTEAAIGNTFKVFYAPKNLKDDQKTNEDFIKTITLKVNDGYNVYEENELAYINKNPIADFTDLNKKHYTCAQEWTSFKQAKGLKLDYYPAGIYLQDDITLTKDNVPSTFFISSDETNKASIVGGVRDFIEIYSRNMSMNEKFEIDGNFFTFNADAFPFVTISDISNGEADEYQTSHTSLFFIHCDDDGVVKHDEETNKTTALVENVNFIGNAPLNKAEKLAGGLILNKVSNIDFTIRNCKTIRWFISYFPLRFVKNYLIDNCASTDSFNTFVYNWGCENVVIKDSLLKGAGGPAIISDHIHASNAWQEGKWPNVWCIPHTTIINSEVESYVTGNEGWFKAFGADALMPLVSLMNEPLKATYSSTFITNKKDIVEPLYNIISLNKDSGAQGPNSKPDGICNTRGTIDFFDGDNTKIGEFSYGKNNPYFESYYKQTLVPSKVKQVPPMLETNTGGYVALVPTGMADIPNVGPTPTGFSAQEFPFSAKDAMKSGDMIALYYLGMQVVLGYSRYTPAN